MFSKLQKNIYPKKGFSLIELMVVVAIFLIITAITLNKQSKFSSDILITNLAYQLALSIREAQVYGIGSKQGESNNFKIGYGIHLQAPGDISQKSVSYNIFADKTDTGIQFIYEPGSDLDIDLVNITQGQKIRNFCGYYPVSGNWECWQSDGVASSRFDLNIVFIKPDPEAHIFGGYNESYFEYTEAVIVVESALGNKCRTVRVTGAGQISVDPYQASDNTFGCELTP